MLSFLLLHEISPVSHSVWGSFKRLFIIYYSVWYFGNYYTVWNMLASLVAVIGVILYSFSGTKPAPAPAPASAALTVKKKGIDYNHPLPLPLPLDASSGGSTTATAAAVPSMRPTRKDRALPPSAFNAESSPV